MPDNEQHTNMESLNGHTNGIGTEAELLPAKICTKDATIGVVGLGYVGLPLALEYASQGFRTVGIDINDTYVDKINAGENFNKDLKDADVRRVVERGHLSAVNHFDDCADIDIFFICVPTPVNAHKEPDTSYIESATRSIAEHLRPGQLVILKSTTHPDTTEGIILPILKNAAQADGLTVGEDYFLAFSPERIDPGNKKWTTKNTPIVVGGVTELCTKMARLAIQQVVEQVHTVSSPKVAEMEKLLENIYRSVNIALVNELAQLCDRMGNISIWEVIEAAATKPFGFKPFYPGPGLGGHCIPVDPHYLSWLAKEYDFETSFITLSARINEYMPFYVADAVVKAIAEQPVRLSEAKVLILGVAFKKNVDDTRHSPAETVIRLLRERGLTNISFADPMVESYSVATREGRIDIPRTEITEEVLQSHDVAVLVTDHDVFPYDRIAAHAPAIVDARNGFADREGERDNLWLLGGGQQSELSGIHAAAVEDHSL